MTNLDRLPSALILSSLTTLLVACGGKEEVVQAPPPKPKPVITQPEPVEVEVKQLSGSELIAKLNLDPRLMLADDMAGTQQEREKVLTFFNAMLEGDMGMLRTMVSSDDVLQLEALADLGGFEMRFWPKWTPLSCTLVPTKKKVVRQFWLGLRPEWMTKCKCGPSRPLIRSSIPVGQPRNGGPAVFR